MRDNGASAERAWLHVAGEREQVSEPRAAATRRPDRREYDRLRLVRNREEGWAILAAAQFRNPREVSWIERETAGVGSGFFTSGGLRQPIAAFSM